jgi:formylglycine-generating enzyme required for sulfatase activity
MPSTVIAREAVVSFIIGTEGMVLGTSFATIGITQTPVIGVPGISYSYSVTGSAPGVNNMPVFAVSWGDAARFCNWLQNGQPTSGTESTGTTETGAYALNGATTDAQLMAVASPAHSGTGAAQYFLPTENEWYKAAYYSGGGTNSAYYTYPTQSNSPPGNSLALALTTSNEANYNVSGYTDPTNYLTPVGEFVLSPSHYGTYDQGGDIWEWDETVAIAGSSRRVLGGDWYRTSYYLSSSDSSYDGPSGEYDYIGFRVASSVAVVPEPNSIALLMAGIVGLLAFAWRRRRQAA